MESLMYSDLEYLELPAGQSELEILDFRTEGWNTVRLREGRPTPLLRIRDIDAAGCPKESVSEEVFLAGAQHLRLDEEGRSVLSVRSARRLSVGVYEVDAPELLAAMFP